MMKQYLQKIDHNIPLPFIEQLAAFSFSEQRTLTRSRNGIPCFTNEFWTSGQRKASRLHEVSYRACFKPQLPAFFIERLTRPGDAVYDPFMGRGTTPLQAALMGRRPVGSDINPLSAMLLRPRLTPRGWRTSRRPRPCRKARCWTTCWCSSTRPCWPA